ncbi:MAG: 30S ribosomal protein S2 [Deltaproteobacteria bacterium]|jgi:small subunit ribosomal protein S2|nr:30S ribosomal protein S2 [Deltaproteobacteria bacterium]
MPSVSLRDLLESGVHFGHQTRLWNPRMKPYIYGERNGVHIINLQKTAQGLLNASRFISQSVSQGGSVLFVGTKRAAQEVVQEQAERCGQYYVNNRWLGGTLTNFTTVKKSIERLVALEKARDEGRFELITKKEALDLTRKIEKMDRSLGGIKHMKALPTVIFVIDPKREHIAIREATKLGIPVVGLCDTNCDPQGIKHVIPGNDDAIKSIRLFTTAIADAVTEGNDLGRNGGDQPIVRGNDLDVEIVRRRGAEPVEADDRDEA